jgi:predicted NBD/HSP70 family sugar kinase
LLGSLPKHVFAGVGVGVVGITRRSDGFVHLAPNLGWHNVPLAEILGEELGYDGLVLVANDADLGAIAEHRRGVRPGVQNLIYISGEVGIGTGIIVDGEPVLGSAGYAGEAGHMLVNPNGRRCRCGSVGCWETEAGEVALLRHAGTPDSGAGLEGVKAIADRAAAGDAKTLQALSEVGHWLGTGIGNLVNIFNPEMVVLGGMYHRLFPFLEEAINEAISTRALDAPAKMVTVTRSGLNSDAALIGASELVFSRVVADPARVTRAGLEA